MHWRRYDRLRRQHDHAVQDSLAMLAPYAKRMASRLNAERITSISCAESDTSTMALHTLLRQSDTGPVADARIPSRGRQMRVRRLQRVAGAFRRG